MDELKQILYIVNGLDKLFPGIKKVLIAVAIIWTLLLIYGMYKLLS